jgi:hypothetical protein
VPLCVYNGARLGTAVRYALPVPTRETKPHTPRKPFTGRGLIREVSYLHEDEAAALERRADKERCSKAEIIRRALRAYLGIED